MAPAVPIMYTGQKETKSYSQKNSAKMTGKSRKFPMGHAGLMSDYRHPVEITAESEGFGSSGRVDTEMTLSEDSCSPRRKCISLNGDSHDRFGVPLQVLPCSKMSKLERRELKVRLKRELEEVRILQKRVAPFGMNTGILSPSSDIRSCSDGQKRPPLENTPRLPDHPAQGKKRLPQGRNGPRSKKVLPGQNDTPKQPGPTNLMNPMLMKQFGNLLNRLMTHQYGWVFKDPVDVVTLKIPDYFNVIKHPMDLGTVKSKLSRGEYSSPLDFAADVRLTFSNAMTYNPPGNDVHFMAQTLSKHFEQRWKAIKKNVAPRDWPPFGWEVDRAELEFIREGHKMMAERVNIEELENVRREEEGMALDRYKVFLKQYQEWVEHNKDKLEEESYMFDQDYHPGRRKRGKDYEEGMYELPFYYPGQICYGKVTTLHLYQGAFVDIGGVHEGWVPIKGNDWYWIRQHIKVGMHVIVEVLAKRDPYRFRFPLELRFVDPNIDHLLFNRFEYAPIFHRDDDTNPDELRRDCRRPPLPRKDLGVKVEEESLLSNHPYVDKLWQIHVAEQTILDDMEADPHKYEGKKLSELTDEEEFDEQNSVEYTKAYYKNSLIPKMILKTSVKELDLEAAYAERQYHNKLQKEAEERGEEYKIEKLRRTIEMDEYDFMHWRRSFEERQALLRDISCRRALGLPLKEPGRYVDPNILGKNQYDPSNPLYRYDYWGEPKNSEKSKQEKMIDAHNKSIVGKGAVWYEMTYEDAIKERMEREAREKRQKKNSKEEEAEKSEQDNEDEDDDSDDDFDYSILSDVNAEFASQPHVNGTESPSMSDEGMFEE